jgi:hypothetical protein
MNKSFEALLFWARLKGSLKQRRMFISRKIGLKVKS